MRKRVIFASVFVLAAGGVIVGGLWRMTRLKPGAAGQFNAAWVRIAEEGQPAGDNAWSAYADATAAWDNVPPPITDVVKPSTWPAHIPWPPRVGDAWELGVDAAAVDRGMQTYIDAGMVDRVDAIAKGVRFVRPEGQGAMLDFVFRDMTSVREIGRWCRWRLRRAADAGNDAETVRAFDQGLAVGGVLLKQCSIIEHLVGWQTQSMMLEEVRGQAGRGALSPAVCAELLQVIDARRPKIDVLRGLRAERLSVLDSVNVVHSDDGSGDGWFLPAEGEKLAARCQPIQKISAPGLAGMMSTPTKATVVTEVNRMFDSSELWAKTPFRARAGSSPDLRVADYHKRFPVLGIVMPAIGSYIQRGDEPEIDAAMTRVMLAIEMHRAKFGDYPERIEAMPAVGGPWFTPAWNGEVRYRRTAASYQLYWIGRDGVDDGGQGGQADRAAWGNTVRGVDYLYHAPAPDDARKGTP